MISYSYITYYYLYYAIIDCMQELKVCIARDVILSRYIIINAILTFHSYGSIVIHSGSVYYIDKCVQDGEERAKVCPKGRNNID